VSCQNIEREAIEVHFRVAVEVPLGEGLRGPLDELLHRAKEFPSHVILELIQLLGREPGDLLRAL